MVNIPKELVGHYDYRLGQIQQAIKVPPILAGGAVRDAINRKPVKDLDVFVPAEDNGQFRWVVDRLTEVFGEPTHSYMEEFSYRTYQHSIVGVVTFDNPEELGPPIQIVGMDMDQIDKTWCPHDLVETFDWGISQAAYSLVGGLYVHENFVADVAGKTLTLLPHVSQMVNRTQGLQRSLRKLLSLAEKYPGFDPVVDVEFFDASCEPFDLGLL